MRKNVEIVAAILFLQVVLSGENGLAQSQVEKAPYPATSSLDQYLIQDKDSKSRRLAAVLRNPFRMPLR